MRLIDADALRAEYQAILDRGDMFCEYDIIGMLDNAPTEERPQGEWRLVKNNELIPLYCICTNCREIGSNKFNFCPNCGADMRGDNNEIN